MIFHSPRILAKVLRHSRMLDLKHACARSPCTPQEVLWFNMREEPVVYVNGRPFVLREQVVACSFFHNLVGFNLADASVREGGQQ